MLAGSAERFWRRIRRGCGPRRDCWNWQGCLKHPTRARRRGRLGLAGGRELPHGMVKWGGRKVGAHRVAYALANNKSLHEVGLVGHSCDNPRCVNPAHLHESNHSKNLQEAWERGRRRR